MPVSLPTASHRRTANARRAGLALAALIAVAIAAPAAHAADAKYEGISADGAVAFFSTTDQLVPGDTDTRRDVYERSFDPVVGDYVTRRVSTGPVGGNDAFDAQYYGINQAGTKVFFVTSERLTPDDTDNSSDIYMRDLTDNTTTLVSRADSSCATPNCGNGPYDASSVPGGVSSDGNRVFFATTESLSPDDGDTSLDVYARDLLNGSTVLVSRGDSSCEPSGCGKGAFPAFFLGASASGDRAVFSTAESLSSNDADASPDLYERNLDANTTQLVSVPGTCPVQNCDPAYGGISSDGTHVFFETNDRISGADTDSSQDVYDWSNGTATLASTGPDGGNGADNALYAGSSPSGGTVFFATGESLDATADIDTSQDVYARVGGATTELVSQGDPSCRSLPANCGNGAFPASLRWVSPDPSSSAVVLSTAEPLTSADTDTSQDVYLRDLATQTTTLVSRADSSCATPNCGNGPYDANFAGASSDGSRIFFITDESLVPADTDSSIDVYERDLGAGTTTLVSQADSSCTALECGNGPFDAQLHGVSQDGSRAFFVTAERLSGFDDFAGESDIYSRSSSGTLLVSMGNYQGLVLGPTPPTLTGTDPASPDASSAPAIVGQADPGTSIKIYANSSCTGQPTATGTSQQLAAPGIPVTVAVGATVSFWATAEAEGVTSPCSTSSVSYRQQDPPSDPGTGGGSGSGPGGSPNPPSSGGGHPLLVPQTQITFAPASKTRARRPVFRFTDATGQAGTTFLCKLDKHAWRACSSPIRLTRLRWGRHTFQVTGRNAAGVQEPNAVKHSFKVVRG